MKIKNLLPVAAMLALPLGVFAMPATPEILVKTNPDGSKVKIRMHGNRDFNFTTDETGTFILERSEDGFWVKAERNGAFLMNVEADLERLKTEKFGEAVIPVSKKNFSYNSEGRSDFPTIGDNVRSLVVLLEYPDLPFTMENPVDFYTRYMNDSDFKHDDLSGCARDYFVRQSNGKFNPHFDVFMYKMPEPHTYYNDNNWTAALEAALRALDSEIDYSKYDFDGDGRVDTVYFFYSGYGQADTQEEEYIWPHQSASLSKRNIYLDGVSFENYACSNSLRGGRHYLNKDNVITGIGTVCHEFGHVLGLPDLYHTEDANSKQAPGQWTIMADGPYLNDGRTPPAYTAPERYVLGWLDYEEAKEGESYTLKPIVDEPRAIRFSLPTVKGDGVSSTEYYVIENRTKKADDEYLPNEGAIVWHIQFNRKAWTTNKVNNSYTQPLWSLHYPHLFDKTEMRAYAAWPYKKPNSTLTYNYIAPNYNTAFKPYERVNYLTNYITNIAYDEEKDEVTFDYNKVKEAYEGQPANVVLERLKNENGTLSNRYKLAWNAPQLSTKAGEEVKDYIATIKYYSSNGSTFIIDNIEGKSTGGKPEISFSLTTGVASRPCEFSISAVSSHLPSLQPKILTLTPADWDFEEGPYVFEKPLSIEDIIDVDNVQIAGGKGEVIAPLGAEVYTVNGVRVGQTDLVPGIYVVRFGSRVEKVIVR